MYFCLSEQLRTSKTIFKLAYRNKLITECNYGDYVCNDLVGTALSEVANIDYRIATESKNVDLAT